MKIHRHGASIGWPVVVTAATLTEHALEAGFDFCFTEETHAGEYVPASGQCRHSIRAEEVHREIRVE